MVRVKSTHVKHVSAYADYELENGILLFSTDWNGEIYGTGFDPINESDDKNEYRPVYENEEVVGFDTI